MSRRAASLVCLASLALAACAGGPGDDCQALMDQFDRHVVLPDRGSRTVPGVLQRDVGELLCRNGRAVEGLAELRSAVGSLGYRPVR